MTNFEKMKPGLPPGTGIKEVAKVLTGSADGRCVFCAYNYNHSCGKGICKDGIREWLESEAEENG
jgi:hypothetical protein